MDARITILILIMLIIPISQALTGIQDSIGMVLLGDVGRGGSPLIHWLDRGLIIDYFEIPMAQSPIPESELFRYMNLYFPRTLDRFLEEYDMMVICEEENLFHSFTSPRHQDIMYRAVKEEGVALFNTLPHEYIECNHWANSRLSETLPHDYGPQYMELDGPWTLSIDTESDLPPVFTPFIDLGIEKYRGPELDKVNPRPGSTIWARAVPHNTPFYISWEYGEQRARISVAGHDLDEPWWGSPYRGTPSGNPLGGDLFLNIVYWSVGMEPITDMEVVRMVRNSYEDFLMERGLTISLIDFIDKFGANVAPLEQDLDKLAEGRSVAKHLYMEQKYEETLEHLQSMFDTMESVEQRAVELKESAFFWIYLIEWSVVTATFLVVGFLTWSLMIRKRLYRKVQLTKSGIKRS